MTQTHTTYSVVPAPNVPEANTASADVITLGADTIMGSYFGTPGQFGSTGGDFTGMRRNINHVAAGALSRAILYPYSISHYIKSSPNTTQPHWNAQLTAYGAPYFPKYDGLPTSDNNLNANNVNIPSSTSNISWSDYGGADVRGQSFHSHGLTADLAEDRYASSSWEIDSARWLATDGKYWYGYVVGSSFGSNVSTNNGSISNSRYEMQQTYNMSASVGSTGMAPITIGWSRYTTSGLSYADTAHQGGSSVVNMVAIDEDGRLKIVVSGQWNNLNRFPRAFLVESNVRTYGYSHRSSSTYRGERYNTSDATITSSSTGPGYTMLSWPSGTADVDTYSNMSNSTANSVWRIASGYPVKLTPIF